MSISIHSGSILDSEADVLVNPANSFLNHGGGLAAIIEQAALKVPVSAQTGQRDEAHVKAVYQWHHDHADAPLIPVGGCHVTSPGMLPFKAVIHAVGPVWGGGEYLESNLLANAHQRACHAAYEGGYKSIAFPAISCGIFGYPAEEAALMAMSVARGWSHLIDVEFWPFGYEAEFEKAMNSWKHTFNPTGR